MFITSTEIPSSFRISQAIGDGSPQARPAIIVDRDPRSILADSKNSRYSDFKDVHAFVPNYLQLAEAETK